MPEKHVVISSHLPPQSYETAKDRAFPLREKGMTIDQNFATGLADAPDDNCTVTVISCEQLGVFYWSTFIDIFPLWSLPTVSPLFCSSPRMGYCSNFPYKQRL